MKKIYTIIGTIFICFSIVFLLVFSFIVKTDGKITKDLLGSTIPTPPLWTSYIPWLGSFADYLFQFFSIHGLVSLLITVFGWYIGCKLIDIGGKKPDKKIYKYQNALFDNDFDKHNEANKEKPVIILGQTVDKENFPILYEWAKSNPDTLESQLKSIADKWHEGDIGMAMIALETDLTY